MSKHAQVAAHLADNISALRESRGLTQAQMAKIAGIPRPTWANVESGAANPTLQVLLKIAEALQVSLEELVAPPRPVAKLYRADDLPVKSRGKVRIRKLLPEPLAGLEIERLELPPGANMRGVPHTIGTREYLTCERGLVELSAGDASWQLHPGDVAVFRGDQRHGYRNPGGREAIAYSVIALAPPAS
jgi:transcriptional regulator with XRE-family HTH domain